MPYMEALPSNPIPNLQKGHFPMHTEPTLILKRASQPALVYYHLHKKVLEPTINTKYKSDFKDLLLAETRSVAHQLLKSDLNQGIDQPGSHTNALEHNESSLLIQKLIYLPGTQ